MNKTELIREQRKEISRYLENLSEHLKRFDSGIYILYKELHRKSELFIGNISVHSNDLARSYIPIPYGKFAEMSLFKILPESYESIQYFYSGFKQGQDYRDISNKFIQEFGKEVGAGQINCDMQGKYPYDFGRTKFSLPFGYIKSLTYGNCAVFTESINNFSKLSFEDNIKKYLRKSFSVEYWDD